MDGKILEEMFFIMCQNTGLADAVSCYHWEPPLVIDGHEINYISYEMGDVHVTWYNEYEEPQPLEYYKKDVDIQPNKNIFIYLFGDR